MEKRSTDSERDHLRTLTEEFLSQNSIGKTAPIALHLTIFQKLKKSFGKNLDIDKFQFQKNPRQFSSFITVLWGILIFLMIIVSIFHEWYLNLITFLLLLLVMVWSKVNSPLLKKIPVKSLNVEGNNFRISFLSEKRENFDVKMAKILFITHFDSDSRLYQPLKLRFIIHLRIIFTILVSVQIFLFTFLYSQYSPLLIVIHWVFVIIEGVLIVVGNSILVFPKSGIQPNIRFENALRSAFLINLLDRIRDNNPKLTWCDIQGIFLDGEDAENQGSAYFFNKYAQELSEYKDIYIIHFESLLFPIHLQQFSIANEKSMEFTHQLADLVKHYFLRQNITLPRVYTRKSRIEKLLYAKNFPIPSSVRFSNKRGEYKWISRNLDKPSSFLLAQKLIEVCLDLVFFIDKAIDDHFHMDAE